MTFWRRQNYGDGGEGMGWREEGGIDRAQYSYDDIHLMSTKLKIRLVKGTIERENIKPFT